MKSDRAEFGRSPKPTATFIFRKQQIRDIYFQLHETPKNGTFERVWVGYEGLLLKKGDVRSSLLKYLYNHNILV